MAANTVSLDKNTLAGFLWNQLDEFRQNRQDLEDKWNDNYAAYKAEVEPKEDRLKEGEAEGWRSTRFLNKTKQKITYVYALFIDMILQGGKIPYMLKPSPADSDAAAQNPETQQSLDANIDDMTDLIDQQLADCKADRHLMKIVLSGAIYGEYWSKNSIIDVTRTGYTKTMPEGIAPEAQADPTLASWESTTETHKSPSPWLPCTVWSMYWDVEDPDLQEGAGVYQETPESAHWLRGQKGKSYFINDHIDSILDELTTGSTNTNTIGKNTTELPPRFRNLKFRTRNVLYAEYWGRVPRKVADDFEAELTAKQSQKNPDYSVPDLTDVLGERDKAGDEVEIMAGVVQSGPDKTPMVIRYVKLPPGNRPFNRGFWEEDLDALGGISVADNMKQSQAALNGFVRAMEDNIKLAGNVMVGVKRRYITNIDDIEKNGMKPGTIFDISEDCPDARMAVQQIQLNDMINGIVAGLQKWEQWNDEESLVPKIAQGQATAGNRTAYELSTMMEKAGKYVGAAIRNLDESTIEPGIQYVYEYNMDDPNVQVGKGNFVVNALGFTSFTDRVVRVSKIMQFISLLMSNPMLASYGKWSWIITEIAKSLDMDPDQALKSEQERQEEAQAAAEAQAQMQQAQQQAQAQPPPPEPPNPLEIAKTESDVKAKEADTALKVEKMRMEKAKFIRDLEKGAGKPEQA